MNLLTVLGILFISLIVITPIVERFGPKTSEAQTSKISRWILPLIAFLMVLQLLAYLFK